MIVSVDPPVHSDTPSSSLALTNEHNDEAARWKENKISSRSEMVGSVDPPACVVYKVGRSNQVSILFSKSRRT